MLFSTRRRAAKRRSSGTGNHRCSAEFVLRLTSSWWRFPSAPRGDSSIHNNAFSGEKKYRGLYNAFSGGKEIPRFIQRLQRGKNTEVYNAFSGGKEIPRFIQRLQRGKKNTEVYTTPSAGKKYRGLYNAFSGGKIPRFTDQLSLSTAERPLSCDRREIASVATKHFTQVAKGSTTIL